MSTLVAPLSLATESDYQIVVFPDLDAKTQNIVYEIHQRLKACGDFVERDDEERLFASHRVLLDQNGEPLAGVSLLEEDGGRWAELARWWSHPNRRRNGFSQRVLTDCMDTIRTSTRRTFALTREPEVVAKLTRYGFAEQGTVSTLQRSTWARLWPERVQAYPLGERDPRVLLLTNQVT